jgi:hypothetical protein
MRNVRIPYRALECALVLEGAAGGSTPYLTVLSRAGVCTGAMETPVNERNNLIPGSIHTLTAHEHIVGSDACSFNIGCRRFVS